MMYRRNYYDYGWAGLLGLAALGTLGSGSCPYGTFEEEEARSVLRMRNRARRRERKAAEAVAGLAKATGPCAQHFGYCRHVATRCKPQSDSLKRMLRRAK